MFSYHTSIHMHDTDAAGLLFFSNQFKLIHDAYEALFESLGLPFPQLLRNEEYFMPIVHAEADYKRPLFVGDRIRIDVDVGKIGNSSFALDYRLLNKDEELVGSARTVHVTVAKTTRRKVPLPQSLRDILKKAQ